MVFLSLVKKRATFTLSYRLIHALCESRLWEDIHQCTVFFPTSKNKLFSFNAISQFLVSSLAHFSNNSELGTSFIPTAHVLAAGSFPFLGDVTSPCCSARLNFFGSSELCAGSREYWVSGQKCYRFREGRWWISRFFLFWVLFISFLLTCCIVIGIF